jgi:hypothetical protein
MYCSLKALAPATLLLATLGSALAADLPTKAPPSVFAPAPWAVVFGGAAVDQAGYFGDAGMVGAFNRNLNQDGWLFRVRGGAGHYDYFRSPSVKQDVDYQVGEVMLGYQKFIGTARFSLYAGANVEHHANDDPNAVVKGTEWGFKIQGEVYNDFSAKWYGLLLATYSTAFNSYFALGKVGYRINSVVSFGPEVTGLGNDRFDNVRGGGFVAVNITNSTQFIVSGGYAWDERRDSLNDTSGGYGTVHVRTLF